MEAANTHMHVFVCLFVSRKRKGKEEELDRVRNKILEGGS